MNSNEADAFVIAKPVSLMKSVHCIDSLETANYKAIHIFWSTNYKPRNYSYYIYFFKSDNYVLKTRDLQRLIKQKCLDGTYSLRTGFP